MSRVTERLRMWIGSEFTQEEIIEVLQFMLIRCPELAKIKTGDYGLYEEEENNPD